MGRRSAVQEVAKGSALGAATANMAFAAIGFVLEVAMLAGFVYWGFGHAEPWNLLLGIGVPAVVVVLWGIFMAPKSARRFPEATVSVVSLVVFLAAGAALLAAGSTGLGIAMLAVSVAWFAGSEFLRRR